MNSGSKASLKATAFAAITCINGPPWVPGNTRELNFFSKSGLDLQIIIPPLGPLNVLCVVDVTTSANGTGEG